MSYLEFVRRTFTVVLITTLVVLSVIILWSIRSFILIAFTGWVISVALEMPIARLQKWGLPRGYSILITVIGVFVGLTLLITLILPPIFVQMGTLVDELPALAEEGVTRYEQFYNNRDYVQAFLPEFTLEDYQNLSEADVEFLEEAEVESAFQIDTIFNSAVPILGGIGSLIGDLVANLLLVLFITLYFILDPLPYYQAILSIFPKEQELRAVEIINEVRRIVTVWLGALVVSIFAQAVMVIGVLGIILQIPNALALGLIAGISNIVPNIGFYLALIPVIIVTAADDPQKLLPAIILYVIAGEIEGKVISPRVVANSLSLPAAFVLIFQLIAAVYLGFFGILLAVPLLAIMVMLVRELYVHDSLGKKGHLTDLHETADGKLVLTTPDESS